MLETILELLENKQFKQIRELIGEKEPADIALILNSIGKKELTLVFRLLPKELAAEAFVELETDAQTALISSFSDNELKDVLDELYLDDAVDLIEEMPANVVRRILQQTDSETRETINNLLKYPKDSAGSIMTVEYVGLRQGVTVEDAFSTIRRTAIDKETIYNCYVKDARSHLVGVVSVKDLLLADPETEIDSIMETNVISINTLEDKEAVAQKFAHYDLIAAPVVDSENRLVGIVTVDDALDVMEEEATEDIEKMAAITPTDKPYMKTGVFETWYKRVPWLMLLMISATVTSVIIAKYEATLIQCGLAAFMPMLMDTGGNAGGQASVTIIRGLSLGEIRMGQILRIMWKEFRVALLCGLTMAVVTFGKLMIVDRPGVNVALVVSGTLLCTVIVAKLVGCSLPILAKRVGFDPAVMASPFITTIVDTISLVIYFQIAMSFLA